MTTTEARRRLTVATNQMALARITYAVPLQPLQGARDVVNLLAEQIDALRLDGSIDSTERARLIGGLCTVALRAIEQAEGDERLSAIQQVLQNRATNEKERQKNDYR
jgi:hypothetical protein